MVKSSSSESDSESDEVSVSSWTSTASLSSSNWSFNPSMVNSFAYFPIVMRSPEVSTVP